MCIRDRDTGDMLYRKKIPMTSEDTFETLHDKLMVLGGEAITEALQMCIRDRYYAARTGKGTATSNRHLRSGWQRRNGYGS